MARAAIASAARVVATDTAIGDSRVSQAGGAIPPGKDTEMSTYQVTTVEELIADYREYEHMLFLMGRDYRDIPEGAFERIEAALKDRGYEVIHTGASAIIQPME